MKELPIACSLDASALADRQERWTALADEALMSADQTADGVQQRYRDGAGVEAELRELVRLERECCPFLDLRVERVGPELRLEISGPPEAAEIVGGFAGA